MCAERDPLDCHRCLLVARALAERGLTIGHILYDGTIEPHAATEQRLLALDRRRRRPLRNWTARANSGSVSPPRPRRRLSGKAKQCGGEVGIRELTMRAPVLAFCCRLLPALVRHPRRTLPRPRRRRRAGAKSGRADRCDAARHAQSAAAAAACQSQCAVDAGQGIVRPQADAAARPGAADRLLRRRLPRRRGGAADHRPDLAGHAAVAQPQLGHAQTDLLHRSGSATTPRKSAGTDY